MSREEKLREIAEQQQALMREIYGFDAGVAWAEARIIKLLEERYAENVDHCEWGTHLFLDNAIALIKGKAE